MRINSNKLLLGILIGILLGFLSGGFYPEFGKAIYFIGELFIKALLMLVVPLVMTSIIVGITGLGDIRKLGQIGRKTVIYYMSTTALSVIVGIFLVNLVNPGFISSEQDRIAFRGGETKNNVEYSISNNNLLLSKGKFENVYDNNFSIILTDQDSIYGEIKTNSTEYSVNILKWLDKNGSTTTPNKIGKGYIVDLRVNDRIKNKESSITAVLKNVFTGLIPKNLFKAMVDNDVLPLIMFSLLFGAMLTTLGPNGQVVVSFFRGVNEVIMKIIHLLMLVAPIGIGALIAGRLGNAGGFSDFIPELVRLSKYASTVIIGLLIHGMLTLPLILLFFGKRNVWRFTANMASSLTTAFSTASSSATLPVTMQCAVEKNKVSKRTASFVLPLGATINMDGTALYEAVAAIFIAQIYGIDLTSAQMVVIFLTATLAAIGAAGIPEAGLVTMVIVLQAVNLPIEGISLILIIDWFLDRCRTTINVWGDAVGSAVIDRQN
ncbi:MAG: dicarboxylate/amino acid:cation symporter [Candidatus Marinimicrobia bacterium]|nr:dicarboxylate/amino acid:cation symporter [Candidatus Neomarinimicrobiota bacterium]MBL7023026.1 dicarboxylate/amino acid:cation symporter [Candidatus Neomarinimicrobiota bacterium]